MRYGLHASAFDPFHPGYLWAWSQAISSGACDEIVAAVHCDPSVDRKWKRKPVLTPEERSYLLLSMRRVVAVIHYQTEYELRLAMQRIQPACIIIGEEYQNSAVTGGDLGIPIFWSKRNPGWSGTEYCKRLAREMK